MPEITVRIPRLPYGILGISIALHIGLLCLIGGWIISRPADPRPALEAFAENSPPIMDEWQLPNPEPEEFITDSTDPSSLSLQSSPADIPGSGANSELLSSFLSSSPATVSVAGNILPESPAGTGGLSTNDNTAGSKGLSGKINVGTIFNTRVESNKLGVLLDVSSSGHSYLPLVINEIERNFHDTVIVLTYGCGMYEKADASQIYLKEFNRCKPEAPGNKNTLGQIAKASDANNEVANLMKQFQTRRNTYVLYAEDCGHTYYGFKKLIEEKVDTIYWFADFRDKISYRVANKLIKELNQGDIKVIAHNFSGKTVPGEGEKIASETHGTIISKIPGRREK